MTPPASPRLPEAVEQRMNALCLAAYTAGSNDADPTFETPEESAAWIALRAAILDYGAARERQGIERAAELPSTMAAEREAIVARRREHFRRDDGWTVQIESEQYTMAGLAKAIRALPVDGATP